MATPPSPSATLSKSRFCYGLQCLKQLWWRVQEPKAPELVPGPALQAVFDRGHDVGARAQREFPGGTLIGHEYWEVAERVADTQAALAAGAPAIYEAAFLADGVYVAVDVLERRRDGHAIVEVKSTLSVKEPHLPDVAIQLHVLRACGLSVPRADVMHLNRACRFPDLSNLFVREDVTKEAEAFLPQIPAQLARMKEAIEGPLPTVAIGPHCTDPYECPFLGRCWPKVGDDHVSTIYMGRKLPERLLAAGIESIKDIPEDFALSPVQSRQVRAVKSGAVVVEQGLADTLDDLVAPVAYLDFETIAPAVPAWPGCGPFTAVPVQLSCHVVDAGGAMAHHEWLADGPGDPRPAMAEAVIRACAGAATVVAYNAPFERRCIDHLAEHVPEQRGALEAVAKKLVDLLPIVRDHVYHPGFGGSFSMKAVGPALLAGLSYENLEIGEGGAASTALEGLLLGGGPPAEERETLRRHLLEYCAQDTLAMVKLVERLGGLAASSGR
jgi:predicted RecB family nuclease